MDLVVVLRVGASLLGLGAVVLALWDMLATTVTVGAGAGPVASRVAAATWRLLMTTFRRRGQDQHLVWGGTITLLAILGTWFVLLVGGWTLVMGWPGVLVEPSNEDPATLLRQLEYATSLVIGRGGPSLDTAAAFWGLVSQAAALSGVLLLSLSIAYVLPVVNAVVSKRRVASTISALGHTPDQLLHRAWNGEDFGVLRLHLIPLAAMIAEVAEQHLAYPIVHYFHSEERHTAIGPSIAVLDDTLTILECCKDEQRLEPSAVIPLRAAITEFLDTLEEAFVSPSDEVGPVPDTDSMRDSGLPLLPEEDCVDGFERIEHRRRLLRALLEHDGWSWDLLDRGSWEDPAMLRRDETQQSG